MLSMSFSYLYRYNIFKPYIAYLTFKAIKNVVHAQIQILFAACVKASWFYYTYY